MKETTTTTENHNRYGGEIDEMDFSTFEPNARRITNQVEAENLPRTLAAMKAQSDKEKTYMHMTLEELKEMKLISNTAGRPNSTLTDEKWQKEFGIRKLFITPYAKPTMRLTGRGTAESGYWNDETMGTYHGSTCWQQYCAYINDILRNIRAGQIDYCYYIYQILDLAKFHYDRLRTRYCDGYWEVWLED